MNSKSTNHEVARHHPLKYLQLFCLKRKYAVLATGICFFFTVLGVAGFHLSHGDYIPLMQVMLENHIEPDRYFYFPIMIYGFFDTLGIGADFAAILWGLVMTFIVFRRDFKWYFFLISLFLYLPSSMLYLGIPSKEHFLVLTLVIFIYMYEKGWVLRGVLSLFFYAFLFRIYLAVVPLVIMVRYLGMLTRVLLSILCVLLVVYYIDGIFNFLVDTIYRRDIFYQLRSDDVRSAWFNPYSLDDFWGVFLNYMYAFFRLNLPVFFVVGAKELFLQIYILFIFFVMFFSIKQHFWIVFSYMVMFFMYPIFELDLGSYLRHVSSWFPIFVYLLSKPNLYNKGGEFESIN